MKIVATVHPRRRLWYSAQAMAALDARPFDIFSPRTFTRYPAGACKDVKPANDVELAVYRADLGGPPPAPRDDRVLYIHIPFCDQICSFCRFSRIPRPGEEPMARYFDALRTELAAYFARSYVHGLTFRAIYWGGGTPSVVSVDILTPFLEWLTEQMGGEQLPPMAFEGEARTLMNPELLETLARFGCKRVSMGVQSFDEELRVAVGRRETLDDVRATVKAARVAGIDEVNIDLLTWLPGQTAEHVRADVAGAIDLGVDDVDHYICVYDPFRREDPLSRSVYGGKAPARADVDGLLEMRSAMHEGYSRAGFRQVYVDHFSSLAHLPSYHANRYGGSDGCSETLAVGVSAQGCLAGNITFNPNTLDEYHERVESHSLSVSRILPLTTKRYLERAFFYFPRNLTLEKSALVAIDPTWSEQYGPALERLMDLDIIREDQDAYHMTELGKLWYGNAVCALTMNEALARTIDQAYHAV